MPETEPATAEPLQDKVIRQWVGLRLSERLSQMAQMVQDRNLLRRGAMKQQDGTLGQAGEPAGEEPVNINVGDQFYQITGEAAQAASGQVQATEPSTAADTVGQAVAQKAAPLLGKLLLTGVLAASGGAGAGVGIPWLLGAFDKTTPPAAQCPVDTDTDTNTQYELRFGEP